MADQRKAALDVAIRKIEKNFGKGSIMRMGDATDMKVASVSSGSLAIDKALGIGGYPRGRIVEIYGPESSGKTTVALHAVAEVQRQGGTAAYIDAENALDPQYAEALGVNIDDLLLSQPDSGEEGLEIADALISSGAVDLVIVDSVAALVPRAEIDGDIYVPDCVVIPYNPGLFLVCAKTFLYKLKVNITLPIHRKSCFL